MANTFLVEHALANVWCSPDQDFQVVIQPCRITNYRGVRRTVKVDWLEFNLPDDTTTFHLFQIGSLHPSLVGLFPRSEQWIKASDHCNIQGMVVDVYGRRGTRLPRFETWLAVLPNRNLIVAIADQGPRFNAASEDVFLRFYSNAFFESPRSNNYPSIPTSVFLENPKNDWANLGGLRTAGGGGDILVEGVRIANRTDLLAMQDRLVRLRGLGVGQVLCYYNGQLVPDFLGSYYTPSMVQAGDWAEVMLDASISEILEFPISDLPTFDSSLDSLRKYLLHRAETVVDTIQYKDDLDFYLTRPVGDGSRYEGRFYYQNTQKAVRMVTHQDWAIPVPFVLGYVDTPTGFTNPMGWTVRVVVRQSGFLRPLVDEASRIKELYRLAPAQRSRALLGLDSTLPFWRADALEASMYTSLMGRQSEAFTTAEVAQAYGYNAISKLVAPSPIAVENRSGTLVAPLPIGLQADATLYEYDADGHLLGWYTTYGTPLYTCRNPTAAFVEGRVGLGGPQLSTHFGTGPYVLDPAVDYFYLKASLWNGTLERGWQVAVEGTDYVIRDNVVYWNLDGTRWLCAIRNTRQFLAYSLQLDATDGLMVFSIQSEESSDYEPANRVEPVPYGKLDLWLNKRPLIENIDYVVRWPQVVICNKEFLSTAPLQIVDVRCTGLPMVDAEGNFYRQMPLDVGFVQYGQLSRNNHYNVRKDKVQRVVVRGGVKRAEEISYPEDGTGVSVGGIQNGDPYAVEEVIVPVAAWAGTPTVPLRQAALDRDRAIEAYMSQFITDPVETNPNPITGFYTLYSPFLAKVIRDIQHGYLVISPTGVPLTNAGIDKLLANYLYLLEYDPTHLNLPSDYVDIHPHDSYQVQTLGVYEHYVVERAAELYLKGKVNLSHFVALDANWSPIQTAL